MAVKNLTEFCGKPMLEAFCDTDMDAYIKLTDEVFYRILHSTGDEMKTVCNFVLVNTLLTSSIHNRVVVIALTL